MDDIDSTPFAFESMNYPMVACSWMGNTRVFVSDPEVTNDIFNKHNKLTEKIDESARMFAPLLGSSLLFGPTDEDWRQKRKAVAHGFYKDRLRHMLSVLKDLMNERVTVWRQECKDNGSTTIDIAEVFGTMLSKNIIHIIFGEDMRDNKLQIDFMTDKNT